MDSSISSNLDSSNLELESSTKSYTLKKMNDPTLTKFQSKSNKTSKFSFSSSNYLPIITNIRPIDESNSISFISNRSFETPRDSTSSLVSSPSSLSVNNSIECKTDAWPLTKGPSSFLKLHLSNLISNSNKSYSPEQENWKQLVRESADGATSQSTESFRYTVSNKCLKSLADLEEGNPLNLKLNSTFIKSFSFNNFNHFRRFSVDNLALASSRYASTVSQRKHFTKTYASSASLKVKDKLPEFVNNKQLRNSFNNFQDYKYSQTKSNKPPSFDPHESFKSEQSTNDKHFTKLQKLTLLCILTVSFCSYCSMSVLAPFFPNEASKKGLSDLQAGFIFSVFALVSVVLSPFLGKLVPIFGAKFLILFGIILGGVSNLLFGYVEDVQNPTAFFYYCVLIRIMESFGTCCHATASYTYVIKLFPHHIGFVFGLTETMVGLALCLGPGIGSFLFTLGGYKLPFYVFGLIVLLCLPFNWYFLTNINDLDDLDVEKDSSSNGSETDQIKTTYWRLLKMPKIFVISMVIVVMSLASAFLEPTFEPHLRKTFALKPEFTGLEFLLGSTSYALSTPVVGFASTKTKNKFSFMLVGTIITAIGLLIIGPSKLIFFVQSSLWLSTIGYVLVQFGHGVGFICTFEAVFDYCLKSGFKDNIKTYGKISGLWSSLFSLGEFIGPLLGGYIVQKSDFQTATLFIAIICILTVPFISVMYVKEANEIDDEDLNEKNVNELNKKNSNDFMKFRSNSAYIKPKD